MIEKAKNEIFHQPYPEKTDTEKGSSISESIIKEESDNFTGTKPVSEKDPVHDVANLLAPSKNSKGIKDGTSTSLIKILKILWVDDDVSINKIVGEMIKILGHKADVAGCAEEALQLLNHNNYDLVITDIGMPDMNGWQFADIIKKKYDGKMKVAVISGWEMSSDETSKHGVSFYITKPFGMAQLKNLIEEIVLQIKEA